MSASNGGQDFTVLEDDRDVSAEIAERAGHLETHGSRADADETRRKDGKEQDLVRSDSRIDARPRIETKVSLCDRQSLGLSGRHRDQHGLQPVQTRDDERDDPQPSAITMLRWLRLGGRALGWTRPNLGSGQS